MNLRSYQYLFVVGCFSHPSAWHTYSISSLSLQDCSCHIHMSKACCRNYVVEEMEGAEVAALATSYHDRHEKSIGGAEHFPLLTRCLPQTSSIAIGVCHDWGLIGVLWWWICQYCVCCRGRWCHLYRRWPSIRWWCIWHGWNMMPKQYQWIMIEVMNETILFGRKWRMLSFISNCLVLAKNTVRWGASMHCRASLGNGRLKFRVMMPQRYRMKVEIKLYDLVMSNGINSL